MANAIATDGKVERHEPTKNKKLFELADGAHCPGDFAIFRGAPDRWGLGGGGDESFGNTYAAWGSCCWVLHK